MSIRNMCVKYMCLKRSLVEGFLPILRFHEQKKYSHNEVGVWLFVQNLVFDRTDLRGLCTAEA